MLGKRRLGAHAVRSSSLTAVPGRGTRAQDSRLSDRIAGVYLHCRASIWAPGANYSTRTVFWSRLPLLVLTSLLVRQRNYFQSSYVQDHKVDVTCRLVRPEADLWGSRGWMRKTYITNSLAIELYRPSDRRLSDEASVYWPIWGNRTISAERPQLVGEVNANFSG
jgi:hypothetical protein